VTLGVDGERHKQIFIHVSAHLEDATIVNQINTAMASKIAGIAISIPDGSLNKVVCDARTKFFSWLYRLPA
jgi:hypothetical protein